MKIASRIFDGLPGLFESASRFKHKINEEDSSDLLANALITGKPFAAGRTGHTELAISINYLARQKIPFVPYARKLRKVGKLYAGIFPANTAGYDAFAQSYLEAYSAMDFIMAWDRMLLFEASITRQRTPNAIILTRHVQTPFAVRNPWTQHLAGKQVLVVHPFKESILSQYHNHRTELFQDSRVLPEFDLKVVTPPVTHGTEVPKFSNWTEALINTQDKIAAQEFDVALVSGGSYGLPLTSFIKTNLQKPAIHMAGSLQLLFGIGGNRWESDPRFTKVFNSRWCRPQEEERPAGFKNIEGGAYF